MRGGSGLRGDTREKQNIGTSTIEIILVGGPFVLKSEQGKVTFSAHSKIVCMGLNIHEKPLCYEMIHVTEPRRPIILIIRI